MRLEQTEKIYAIHGFLGLPSDWSSLFADVSSIPHSLNTEVIPLNFFKYDSIIPFNEWAAKMSQEILAREASPPSRRILMGYSLGGRMALHLLLQRPDLWHSAIIISSHLGFDCESEKRIRRSKDLSWAEKFESMPWDDVIKEWNQQPVFDNDEFAFKREEKDFCRKTLSQVLKTWSVGNQETIVPSLKKLNTPILWVWGTHDSFYKKQGREIIEKQLLNESSQVWEAECGHRVPWQKKEEFMIKISQFLNN